MGNIGGQVSAYANAITSLSAAASPTDVNTANFRMAVQTGPSGYSRIGMQARQGGTGSWRQASLFLDVPNAPGEPTRVVVDAEQFAVLGPSGATAPFVIDGGTTYVNNAMIRNLTADNITAAKLNAAEILQNGTVLRDVIEQNATSYSDIAVASDEISTSTADEVTVISLEFSGLAGTRRAIRFSGNYYVLKNNIPPIAAGLADSTIRFKRNGVTIFQTVVPTTWVSFDNDVVGSGAINIRGGMPVTVEFLDVGAPAGTVTYSVTVQQEDPFAGIHIGFTMRNRSLRIDEFRR